MPGRRYLDSFEPGRQNCVALSRRSLDRTDEVATGDQLGDDHRDALERPHLLVGVVPPSPILDDKNAAYASATDYRDAKQRVIGLLPGFGSVAELRVRACLGQVERTDPSGDGADQSLTGA